MFSVATPKEVFFLICLELKKITKAENKLNERNALAINEMAWGCINNMQEIATAVGADASDIWLAEKLKTLHSDFEDNMVLAACKRCEADYLISNDKKLVSKGIVPALSSADALILLGA